MSLTNPNTVVTEQRLNDFYKGILPYLGGMPEMLANKFSKGDLYSIDEKMIGQWIDGKPLYQKSFTVTLSSNKAISSGVTTNLFYNTIDISSIVQNIDNGILLNDKSYWVLSGETRGFVTCWYQNPATIFVMTLYNRENVEGHFTIQYTKTTDSAISIGSDTDYSTEEKIIGTWIDGKPLWQKTIEVTSFNKDDDNDIGLDSSIQIVNATAIAYDNRNYTYSLPLVNATAALTYSAGYFFTATNYLGLRVGSNVNLTKIVVTLQYTKTN